MHWTVCFERSPTSLIRPKDFGPPDEDLHWITDKFFKMHSFLSKWKKKVCKSKAVCWISLISCMRKADYYKNDSFFPIWISNLEKCSDLRRWPFFNLWISISDLCHLFCYSNFLCSRNTTQNYLLTKAWCLYSRNQTVTFYIKVKVEVSLIMIFLLICSFFTPSGFWPLRNVNILFISKHITFISVF